MKNSGHSAGSKPSSAVSRWIVVLAVAATAVAAYVLRPAAGDVAGPGPDTVAAAPAAALPRMIDLGADRCIPCKMMAPILAELKAEYEGRLVVEFIDVWKDPGAGQRYGIKLIPTQIFFAADGTELFRHEGFYGRDEILAKWRELGMAS